MYQFAHHYIKLNIIISIILAIGFVSLVDLKVI